MHKKSIIISGIGLSLVGVVLLMFSAFLYGKSHSPITPTTSTHTSQELTPTPTPKIVYPTTITSKILWFGDVFWGRYIDDWSKLSPLKTAYPFSGLSTFERDKYQAWIADLECPLSNTYYSSSIQDDTLSFACPTEYTQEAAKWFTAFTLANNHTDNREDEGGFAFTQKTLDEHKIQYFGSFDNARLSDICEVITVPANIVYPNDPSGDKKTIQNPHIPIAVCGYHNIFKLPTDSELNIISQYSQYFPTFVMPHQGKEYTYVADQLQQSYSQTMIDKGADAVIGDHVHSVQNTESYKGKLIVYSLGNFIFDQQFNNQVTQAMGLDMTIHLQYDDNLQKFLDLADSCRVAKDVCLQKAEQMKLTKPQFSLAYDMVASDNSGKLAKKASDEVLQKLKHITRWDSTLQGLKK